MEFFLFVCLGGFVDFWFVFGLVFFFTFHYPSDFLIYLGSTLHSKFIGRGGGSEKGLAAC